MGQIRSGDIIDLLGMIDQDGNGGFILWGRIGDGSGLHACPHKRCYPSLLPNVGMLHRKTKAPTSNIGVPPLKESDG